jgi:hypothetical protein
MKESHNNTKISKIFHKTPTNATIWRQNSADLLAGLMPLPSPPKI